MVGHFINGNIIANKKSLYKENWIEKGIIFVTELFDDKGNLYSYENFLSDKYFPVKYKEFIYFKLFLQV